MRSDSGTFSDRPVSVAMATYNGAKYLEEQLDSILSQTLAPREICVSDDLSTDDTIRILERYKSKGHLRFQVNKKRLGYVGNFRTAVAMTAPDHYVALSDQDDIWLPEKIAQAMRLLLEIETDKPAMVYSDLILVDENKSLINKSFRNVLGQDTYKHCLETLLFGGFVNGCTILMDSEMRHYFENIPENEFITHDTWITLIGYTFGSIAQVAQPSILYRKHGSNATDLNNLKKKSRFERLRDEVKSVLNGTTLFERELECVAAFYHTFAHKLETDQKKTIEEFLKLRGRSYLRKKLAVHQFFAGKWQR